GSSGAEAAPPLVRQLRAEDPPLSFAQQRLWFLHQLDPGSPVYNMPFAFTLRGTLDVAALEGTLREVVRRHESLRTTFPGVAGEPRQVVAPEPGLRLPVVDLGGLPAADRGPEAARLSREDALRPFDLARGPLLRACLLRREEREWTILLNLHHIVSDGWSLGVLVRALSVLYPAVLRGEPSPLPELPIQYADFALWQREQLRGEVLEAQLAWWRQALAGAPTLLELPTDRPRPPVQSGRGAWVPVRLPGEVAAALAELARTHESSLFMALLAGFQALLARLSGQDDLVVGSPVANRNRAEVEGLIGFFVNTLALRARLDRTTTFRGLLAQVRAAALGAYAHQDLPFERLVEELHVPRNLGHNPLVQALLVVQDAAGAVLDLPGLVLAPAESAGPAAKFDLTLSLAETGGQLLGSLDYATDLFDAATARRLAERFSQLLAEAVAAPDLPLGRLPLLTREERRQLQEWNDSAAALPQDVCLHDLTADQAERTPEAVAVVFAGRQLTYRQLAQQAGRLARHLRTLGVGPEVLVGLYAERSLELVVGLLGILQAGGAYVPLDPGYPDERLAAMVEDARLYVLLAPSHLAGRLRQLAPPAARLVLLDELEGLDAPDEAATRPQMHPDQAAYCIFTSGSTGRPKGAVNTHRGIVNRLLWMQRASGLG
ncbi:MAG TPA: condensation domain-containing protein, partial [Thermoanaerobaculia bacterium]